MKLGAAHSSVAASVPETWKLIGARKTSEGVSLTVSDQGPGIAPEHLPHVFDRFYKAEASRSGQRDPSAGSGLGLSIVKAIVERHGGTVAVKSEPGHTVFTLGLRAEG